MSQPIQKIFDRFVDEILEHQIIMAASIREDEKKKLEEKLEKQQTMVAWAEDRTAKMNKKLFELKEMEKEQRHLRAQAENKLSGLQEQVLRLKQELKSLHAKR